MPHPIHQFRASLPRLGRALASGVVRIGFLGGSITDQKTGARWPEPILAWFSQRYPNVRIIVENAAIGATGSDLAAFRAKRDIIERGCDLVFVEYAVNDQGTPPVRRARAREGLLRQLLSEPRDVILVYTFMREHLADIEAGRQPSSILDFEELARHYRIGSTWVGLHALEQVRAGMLKWEEWLPDGLHPEHRGSLSYAECVQHYLAHAMQTTNAGPSPAGSELPAPLDADCWERVHQIPFGQIQRTGPWTERRWGSLNWIDQVLHATAPGARLEAAFEGHTLVAAFDFGSSSSEIRWRIDGGAWQQTDRDRPAWAGVSGWFRPTVLADQLQPGLHRVEIETRMSSRPEATGCTTDLVYLGTVSHR